MMKFFDIAASLKNAGPEQIANVDVAVLSDEDRELMRPIAWRGLILKGSRDSLNELLSGDLNPALRDLLLDTSDNKSMVLSVYAAFRDSLSAGGNELTGGEVTLLLDLLGALPEEARRSIARQLQNVGAGQTQMSKLSLRPREIKFSSAVDKRRFRDTLARYVG